MDMVLCMFIVLHIAVSGTRNRSVVAKRILCKPKNYCWFELGSKHI